MKWLIVILILAIALIAGCTFITCEPAWVMRPEATSSNESCKTECYDNHNVTAYKTEEIRINMCYCYGLKSPLAERLGIERAKIVDNEEECLEHCELWSGSANESLMEEMISYNCYCDVNNCNP
jgi:hypothetical protein